MKTTFLLTLMLSTTPLIVADDAQPADTRSFQNLIDPVEQTAHLSNPERVTFLTRCLKAAKGIGAGSFSFLCGTLCVLGIKKGEFSPVVDPKAGFIEKAGALGLPLFALVLFAETANYSLKNFQEAFNAA